ncbi:hypothetical protein LTR87_003747 [Friedmanniomyces endolithicus]|nr:hypothetical protein LTR87_003747 [Friedmanniomyces endolithicus]
MSPSKPRRRKRDYLPAPPDLWVTSRDGGDEDVDGAGDANNADVADSAAENTRTHDLPTRNHNADHDPFHLSPFPPAPYAMNAFPAVAATAAQRPTPTLRNTQKSAVGNGLGGGIGGGWGGSAAVGGGGGGGAAAAAEQQQQRVAVEAVMEAGLGWAVRLEPVWVEVWEAGRRSSVGLRR